MYIYINKCIFPLLPALSARSRSTRMSALGPSEWESDLECCLEQATVAHIPTSTHTHTYIYTHYYCIIYIYINIINKCVYIYIYIINNILCKHTTSTTYFGLSSQEAWCDGEPSLRGQVTAAAQPACPQRLRDQDAGPLQSLFESGFKHQQ